MSIDIFNIDCIDFMKKYPDRFFDLAICDPDYGVYSEKKVTGFAKKRVDHGTMELGGVPGPEYFQELFRVSKNQIIWGAQYFAEFLPSFSQLIIWDKKTGDNFFADGEAAFCSIPGTLRIFRHQWCGVFKDSERGQKARHPTQKPVALYEWLLDRYAKPGDRILDTHLGSGSSAVAALRKGFHFSGTEINPEFFRRARERLDRARIAKDSELI